MFEALRNSEHHSTNNPKPLQRSLAGANRLTLPTGSKGIVLVCADGDGGRMLAKGLVQHLIHFPCE
jgi:hypothetical protein